jgi:hypothetical protein
MELKRNLELTEIEKFLKVFGDKNPPLKFRIVSNAKGEITNVISTNKDIIKYCKEIGLK